MNRRAFLLSALLAPFVGALRRLGWMAPEETGLSIRFLRSFDATGAAVNRFDVLYGYAKCSPSIKSAMGKFDPSLGWSAPVSFGPGDVYTIAGVYRKNPATHDEPQLQEFIVG